MCGMTVVSLRRLVTVCLCLFVVALGACGRVGFDAIVPPAADGAAGGDQDGCGGCTAQQVCVDGTCRARCNDATDCGAAELCATLAGGGGYCAGISIGGGGPADLVGGGGGGELPRSVSYRVRGGLSPFGAGASGSSVQVRPAME